MPRLVHMRLLLHTRHRAVSDNATPNLPLVPAFSQISGGFSGVGKRRICEQARRVGVPQRERFAQTCGDAADHIVGPDVVHTTVYTAVPMTNQDVF